MVRSKNNGFRKYFGVISYPQVQIWQMHFSSALAGFATCADVGLSFADIVEALVFIFLAEIRRKTPMLIFDIHSHFYAHILLLLFLK